MKTLVSAACNCGSAGCNDMNKVSIIQLGKGLPPRTSAAHVLQASTIGTLLMHSLPHFRAVHLAQQTVWLGEERYLTVSHA